MNDFDENSSSQPKQFGNSLPIKNRFLGKNETNLDNTSVISVDPKIDIMAKLLEENEIANNPSKASKLFGLNKNSKLFGGSKLSPEKKEFVFNEHLEGPVDKERVTQMIQKELNQIYVSCSDVKKLIQKGAEKNGFWAIKKERVHEMAELLEEDIEINDQNRKCEKRRGAEQRLTKIFKKVTCWITWILDKQKKVYIKKQQRFSEKIELRFSKGPALTSPEQKKEREWILNNPKIGLYFYCFLIFLGSLAVFIDRFIDCYDGSLTVYQEALKIGMNFAFGGKFAVIFVVDVMLVLMYRDILTLLRKISFIGKYFNVLLNEHVTLHKFCAYLLVLYATIHALGHLLGTFRRIIVVDGKALDELLPGKFSSPIYYTDLLFTTIPGITGILLLICLYGIFLSSFDFIKRRNFQIFGYGHALYIIFCILLYIHGAMGLFNNGLPFAVAYITPFFAIGLLHHAKKWFQFSFQSPILDVSFSAKNSVAYIKILKPKHFNVTPGQYLFLNVPSIALLQWHPFSICSVGENGVIKLMIKNAGDFTHMLLALLFKGKSDFIVENNLDVGTNKKFQEMYYDFLLKEDEIYKICMKEEYKKKLPNYPKIGLYGPISAPAVGAFNSKNVIFIGSGVGISPYLVFLDEYVNYLRKESKIRSEKKPMWDRGVLLNAYKTSKFLSELKVSVSGMQNERLEIFFKEFQKISFYYIARDCDQLSWITYYVLKLIKYNYNPEKLDIKLFLTTSKEKIRSVDNFLFWRALGKYQKIKEKTRFRTCIDFLTNLPMPVIYKRPEFEKYFEETRKNQKNAGDFFVYGCGPKPFLDSIQTACDKVNKGKDNKFVFFPEKF